MPAARRCPSGSGQWWYSGFRSAGHRRKANRPPRSTSRNPEAEGRNRCTLPSSVNNCKSAGVSLRTVPSSGAPRTFFTRRRTEAGPRDGTNFRRKAISSRRSCSGRLLGGMPRPGKPAWISSASDRSSCDESLVMMLGPSSPPRPSAPWHAAQWMAKRRAPVSAFWPGTARTASSRAPPVIARKYVPSQHSDTDHRRLYIDKFPDAVEARNRGDPLRQSTRIPTLPASFSVNVFKIQYCTLLPTVIDWEM